jgi:hypothetical protein
MTIICDVIPEGVSFKQQAAIRCEESVVRTRNKNSGKSSDYEWLITENGLPRLNLEGI